MPTGSTATELDAPTSAEAAIEARIEAQLLARIEALEIQKSVFDQLTSWIKFGGSAVAFIVAGLGWWIGSSYAEATKNAQLAASSAFEREFFRNAENAQDFSTLKDKYVAALASLAKVEQDLQGFVALRDLVGNVQNFDPLELYSELNEEIDIRSKKTREFNSGETVSLSETTYDSKFRQRASLVFERLLKTVRDDAATGKPKVQIVTLFNAAANASKVDMHFVGLELMEAAVSQDRSKAPENEARLIRQRLTMSRITNDEALLALSSVLKRTSGYHANHVVSEAFNIGLRTARPAEVARMIQRDLPDDVKSISYAHLVSARLLLMSHLKADWLEGSALAASGIRALQSEPKSATWHPDSREEVEAIGNMMQ